MGRKQFKKAIKDKDYDKDDMELALKVWSSDSKIKKDFILNDFIEEPQKFIDEILNNEELKLDQQINSIKKSMDKLVSKDYLTIFDDKDCILIAVGNWRTNHYLAVNYLRQKNDGEKFGSGPTWCIADDENGKEMWKEYELDEYKYPNAYMLLSKKDSTIRYQLTFNGETLEKYIDNDGMFYDEKYDSYYNEWIEYERKYDLDDVFNEVRNINQKLTERNGVYEDIRKSCGLNQNDIIDIIVDHKNSLKGFKNNSENEYYQIREKINKLNSDLEEKTEEFTRLIKDKLAEELNITEKEYNLSCAYDVLDDIIEITEIYKNCNTNYLKIIFDFKYNRVVSGNRAEDFKKRLKKYNITLNDLTQITKLLSCCSRSSRDYFILAYLYTFHKNNPIDVKSLKENDLTFKILNYYDIEHFISEFIEFKIEECVNGKISDMFDMGEKNIKDIFNSILEKKFNKIYNGSQSLQNNEKQKIDFIQKLCEQEKIKLNPISKIVIYIALSQENKKYNFESVNSDKNYYDFVMEYFEKFIYLFRNHKDIAKKSYDILKSMIEKDKSYMELPYSHLISIFDDMGLVSNKDKEQFKTISGDINPEKNDEKKETPKPYEIDSEFDDLFKL